MRSKRIDIIKGIGIILVVLGHTKIQAEGFINLFHVGLFFIAAGYCYSDRYTDSLQTLKQYIGKSIARLYVPYVLFNLFFLLLRNPLNLAGIFSSSAIRFSAWLERIWKILLMQETEALSGPCWFVRGLFILRILFAVTDYVGKTYAAKHIWGYRIALSAVLLLLGGYFNGHGILLKYDFATVCSTYCLYTFGLFWKRLANSQWGNRCLFSSGVNGIFFAVGSGVLCMLNQRGAIIYATNQYPNILFFGAAALAGWCVCWSAAGILEKIQPLSKVCCYLGTRTMSIMMLHLSGFVLVSMVYIQVQGLSWGVLSADYILTTDWWPVYFASGILLPVLLDEIWDRGEKGMKRVTKKQVLAVLVTVLLVANAWIFGRAFGREETVKTEYSGDYTDLDFSLVYDHDYYLQKHPDLAEAFAGKTEVEVLLHFKNHGMKEGRQACAGFDPYYYRQSYADLWAAYGEDMEKYYVHYILWGHRDGRDGNFDVQ